MRLSGKTEQWELECARARYLIKKYFGSLEFKEDTHQYFLPQPDGTKKEYDCVSHFTKQWDPEEDWDEIRRRYAQKHGQTPEYWKEKWDFNAKVACTNGTTVHEFAESCGWLSNGETDKICESAVDQFDPLTFSMIPYEGSDKWLVKDAEDDWTRWVRKEKAAKQFYDDLLSGKYKGLHFCMAETKVYTSVGPFAEAYNNNYAGTFDLLLYYQHPTDPEQSGFCIFDWKGLPLDTPILTENGFVNMGDLQEGMYVFDKDGNKAKILHCSEIHHNPCYKIKFDNNDEIVADIDHRWLVSTSNDKSVVMTTKEIKEYLLLIDDNILLPKIFNPKPLCQSFDNLPEEAYFDDTKYRVIVSVEEVEQVPTRCIEVDSPSHTYLATEKCIVTHNTNVSLTKDFKKPLLSPFQNMNEEPLSHYTMQLSCYQIPMEAIGLKVIARRLIHLKNEGGYDLISVPDVTDKIKDALRGPYKEIHVEKKGYNEEKE